MSIGELEKIREAWKTETDEWLLKTVTEKLNDYEREIRVIICEEAAKRGLIAYKITKKTGSNGIEFEVTVTKKGQDILADIEERNPKAVSLKLLKTFMLFVFVAIVFGLVGLIFGFPAGILAAAGGYIVYLGIRKIWPREEERKIQRQQSREAVKWMKDHPEETQEIFRKHMDDLDIDEMIKTDRRPREKK